MSDDAFLGFLVLGFLIGIFWALRKFIAQLIITAIALFIIAFFLTEPDYNDWWALVGVFLIFGQLNMAKEALIDKPASEKLDKDAKRAVIEMNESRKKEENQK